MTKDEKREWGTGLLGREDYKKAQETYNGLVQERLQMLLKELEYYFINSGPKCGGKREGFKNAES